MDQNERKNICKHNNIPFNLIKTNFHYSSCKIRYLCGGKCLPVFVKLEAVHLCTTGSSETEQLVVCKVGTHNTTIQLTRIWNNSFAERPLEN